MGKALFIIVLGTFVAGSVLYMQSSNTKLATADRQATYQEKMLAREIARSANGVAHLRLQEAGSNYNLALAKINGFSDDGKPNMHGTFSGSMNHGEFRVKAMPLDGQNIKVETVGVYNGIEEKIISYHRVEMLVVKEPSRLRAEFMMSEAGWCSAVFLQQFIPISPGDSTSATTGVVSEDGLWFEKDPEMIFDSGNWRNGETVEPADIVLEAGTRMNFFIGVDQDCSERGVWVDTYNPDDYNHIHYAMDHEESVTEMLEGTYSMIELNHLNEQTWRIAFEDQSFYTDGQYNDIKLNGYGNGVWDEESHTFGGTGWGTDIDGYKALDNWSSQPDYSDQVFEIGLLPCGGPCEVEESES